MNIQVANTIPSSLANGEGMRFVLFVSGCKHNCNGCHNKAAQCRDFGVTRNVEDVYNEITADSMQNKVTFSGGEPFDQPEALIELAGMLKDAGYNIWSYTGYTIEQIMDDPAKSELLEYIDVLVDGRFEQSLTDNAPRYVGSCNQRILPVMLYTFSRLYAV